VDARPAATLVRYLATTATGSGCSPFTDDKSDYVATFVIQGLGHSSYSTTRPGDPRRARQDLVAPERAKMCALGMSGSSGLLAIENAKEAPAPPKAGARWWMEQGPAITS
jgi:hypothetical protein